MAKLIVSNFITLDGFFEGPGKELDWFADDEDFIIYARDMMLETGTMLFGRLTYQMMEQYWPAADSDKDDPLIKEKMNSLPKIVFSKTLSSVTWNNTVLVKDNIAQEVYALKAQPGKNIMLFGSGQIVTALTQHGLIDEYRIIISPVVPGSGNLLFKGLQHKLPLQLLQAKTTRSGIVILYYRPV